MADTTIRHMTALARQQMSVHAAGEIEAIGRTLRDQQHADYFESLLNGALIRIADLSSVLLSLHGQDDRRSWPEVHEIVFGVAMDSGRD